MDTPKHVPEVPAPSRDEQLASLRQSLLGNQYFRKFRGQFGKDLSDHVERIIKDSPTPSQFLVNWQGWAQTAAVMGNLLAQYRRDEWTIAYHALHSALISPEYVIPGEIIPLEEVIPVTLVMIDPTRTFQLAEWLVLANHKMWGEISWFRDVEDISRISPTTRDLFRMLPTLASQPINGDNMIGTAITTAYTQAVRVHNTSFDGLKHKGLPVTHGQGEYQVGGIRDAFKDFNFVYAVMGEQDEVVKRFPRRDTTAEIATWQVSVPRAAENVYFGFHTENEHPHWQKQFPSLASSRGFSFGKGAIALPYNPIFHNPTQPRTWSTMRTDPSYYRTQRQHSEEDEPCSHLIFGPLELSLINLHQ